jgi:intracellular multiplication protein IcmK
MIRFPSRFYAVPLAAIAKPFVCARFSTSLLGHFQDLNMRATLATAIAVLLLSSASAFPAQAQAQAQSQAQPAQAQPVQPAPALDPTAYPAYQPAPAPQQAGYPQAAYPQAAYPQAAYPQAGYPQAPATSYPAPQQLAQPQPQAAPTSLPPLPSDFELGVQSAMPLSPGEIRSLRRQLDVVQKAAADFPHPPKSQTGSVAVSLDPGSAPALIRPFFGVSTSLVLVDSTGAPWPVENFVVGNKALFVVERLDGPSGSSFVISPLQAHGQSNLILKLSGIATPVVINLVLGQKVHDARVEARIQGRGPNAIVSSASLVPGVDSRLLGVLDGVPPGGREVMIRSTDGRAAGASQAWMAPDGKLWMRTGLNIVSPAPLSFVSSSDGMRVYRLEPSSKILAILDGAFVTLTVDGCLQECAANGSNPSEQWSSEGGR